MRAVYDRLGIRAELAPFFADLPARLAASHVIVSRSGAGTVAELGAIGRPSILVPLPGAIDQDQFANAGVLAEGAEASYGGTLVKLHVPGGGAPTHYGAIITRPTA